MAFPVTLTVAAPGQKPLAVALSRYSDFLTNFTVFWTDYFVPLWYAYMVFQYQSEGGDTGAPWPPLTARYAAWKTKHFPGQPIGVLTGAARDSLTHSGDAHAVLTISPKAFAVGTDLPYPIYLQLGTRRMRARPPIRVNADFMKQVGKALQQFAQDSAGKLK